MKLPWKIPLRFAGAIAAILLLLSSGAFGTTSSSSIIDLQIRPDSNEVELTVDGSIEYGYFPLTNPRRLVFDFPGAILDYNDGVISSSEVTGSYFSDVIISQYSVDPYITRLVFHVNDGVDAAVNFDPNSGILVIRVSDDIYASEQFTTEHRISNLIAQESDVLPVASQTREIEEIDISASTLTEPVDPESLYDIVKTETDTLIRFPGMSPDHVRAAQSRFPDRLTVRLFTSDDISEERPRFDLLERGNIWNDVSKQWTSYLDRDGRGIIDLIIYLYPGVTFNQVLDSSGTPVITLQKLSETVLETAPVVDQAIVNELEVRAYEPELAETEEIIIEEPVIIEEEIIVSEPVLEEIVITEPDTVAIPVVSEEIVLAIEETDLPTGPEIGRPDPSGIIADANLRGTTDIDKLPIMLTQADLLTATPITGEPEPLFMKVGEVYLLKVPTLVRASVGNPAVATLNVVSIDEVLVTALASGNTTLLVWSDQYGYISRLITVVETNMAHEQQIRQIINDNNIAVSVLTAGGGEGNPGVILEGMVATTEERTRAEGIAALFAGEGRVTNLIEVTDPSQVLVKVRVVEVDRRALNENLSHFSAGGYADNDDFTFNIMTDLLDPENPGGGLFDNRIRPGVINGDVQDVIFDPVDIVLNELETNREANILSEPNLVTMSGETAHFRVGGEVPYTYLSSDGVTVVEFKEFGISLDLTPYVDSQNNIRLELKPVVRTVDMALAISGIPGFRTREIETTVQLQPGESLVIGGLIQNEIAEIVSKVPILGDIPILGELFRSKRFTEDETELVIILTPYLVEKPYESAMMVGVDPDLEFIDTEDDEMDE